MVIRLRRFHLQQLLSSQRLEIITNWLFFPTLKSLVVSLSKSAILSRFENRLFCPTFKIGGFVLYPERLTVCISAMKLKYLSKTTKVKRLLNVRPEFDVSIVENLFTS